MRQLKIKQSITNHDTQSLSKYLHEIRGVDLITPEEEIILAENIQQGNQVALEKLIKANLRFVISVAKQHQNQGLDLGDLINEGNLGLIKAAQRFDHTKGFKFISFAVWWIRQSITQAIEEKSRIVRLPVNQVWDLSKIRKASFVLEQEYERNPTPAEIAEMLGTTADKIAETLGHSGGSVSIDAPFAHGEERTLLDILENDSSRTDSGLINDSLRIELRRLMPILTQKEREVITLFFGLENNYALSLEGVGEKLNLTRSRIRVIKERALERLRSSPQIEILKTYL